MSIIDHVRNHLKKEYKEINTLNRERADKARRYQNLVAESKKLREEIDKIDKKLKMCKESFLTKMEQFKRVPRDIRR